MAHLIGKQRFNQQGARNLDVEDLEVVGSPPAHADVGSVHGTILKNEATLIGALAH